MLHTSKASPEELLGGSARSASLFDPLRADPVVGAFLDTFSVVMAEKWAVELIKVYDGKQELSDVAWIMLVDIALEAGREYIGNVLKWRGMQVMHPEAQKHLVIGPTLKQIKDWLSKRGVDLVRWFKAWQKWPYASMTHRVQLGQRLEEFASYTDLLKEYQEAYNYLDKPEVWLCQKTNIVPQPVRNAENLSGQIVFLSSRAYTDYRTDMPYTLRPHDVYAMNADRSANTIASGLRLTNMSAPSVSPDGKQIAIGDRGKGAKVRILTPNGNVNKSLALDRNDVRASTWSPVGLLLTVWGDQAQPDQVVMSVPDNDVSVLTPDTRDNGYGAVSPDGKSVAFQNGPGPAVKQLQVVADGR